MDEINDDVMVPLEFVIRMRGPSPACGASARACDGCDHENGETARVHLDGDCGLARIGGMRICVPQSLSIKQWFQMRHGFENWSRKLGATLGYHHPFSPLDPLRRFMNRKHAMEEDVKLENRSNGARPSEPAQTCPEEEQDISGNGDTKKQLGTWLLFCCVLRSAFLFFLGCCFWERTKPWWCSG